MPLAVNRAAKIWDFGHVEVIWYNWAKIITNMGVAAPRVPVSCWGPRPPEKFGYG